MVTMHYSHPMKLLVSRPDKPKGGVGYLVPTGECKSVNNMTSVFEALCLRSSTACFLFQESKTSF